MHPPACRETKGSSVWQRPIEESPGNLSKLHLVQRMAVTFPILSSDGSQSSREGMLISGLNHDIW